jgi:hypothetical protein
MEKKISGCINPKSEAANYKQQNCDFVVIPCPVFPREKVTGSTK